jgi:hypothetical protein
MPGSVRSWLREPCPKYLRVLDDAAQHWLSTCMPGMLAELDRTAGSPWNPPDADSESSQVTAKSCSPQADRRSPLRNPHPLARAARRVHHRF